MESDGDLYQTRVPLTTNIIWTSKSTDSPLEN